MFASQGLCHLYLGLLNHNAPTSREVEYYRGEARYLGGRDFWVEIGLLKSAKLKGWFAANHPPYRLIKRFKSILLRRDMAVIESKSGAKAEVREDDFYRALRGAPTLDLASLKVNDYVIVGNGLARILRVIDSENIHVQYWNHESRKFDKSETVPSAVVKTRGFPNLEIAAQVFNSLETGGIEFKVGDVVSFREAQVTAQLRGGVVKSITTKGVEVEFEKPYAFPIQTRTVLLEPKNVFRPPYRIRDNYYSGNTPRSLFISKYEQLPLERALLDSVHRLASADEFRSLREKEKLVYLADLILKILPDDQPDFKFPEGMSDSICLRSGVCRHHSALMVPLLNEMGYAAAFESTNTHAWVRVRVPDGLEYFVDVRNQIVMSTAEAINSKANDAEGVAAKYFLNKEAVLSNDFSFPAQNP